MLAYRPRTDRARYHSIPQAPATLAHLEIVFSNAKAKEVLKSWHCVLPSAKAFTSATKANHLMKAKTDVVEASDQAEEEAPEGSATPDGSPAAVLKAVQQYQDAAAKLQTARKRSRPVISKKRKRSASSALPETDAPPVG